jgi:hypothetical protein
MPKFTFIAEHESGQKVTYECQHDFIDHVLEDFNLFLRGTGFYPQGDRLEYVSDDFGNYEEDYEELHDEHSEHYWDTERNKAAPDERAPDEWTQVIRGEHE